ncbi:glycosyltransferase family 39 protein [bacterium]|nr:glycosyltransferase family 39 protein [bacterium]
MTEPAHKTSIIKSLFLKIKKLRQYILTQCPANRSKADGSGAPGIIADILIISALSAVIVILNNILSITCINMSGNDFVHHFMEAAAFSDAVSSSRRWYEPILTFFCWHSSYAPALYATAFLLKPIVGEGLRACLHSQLIFIPLIIASVYYIAKPRYGTAAAAAAAIFACALPQVSLPVQNFIVDYPSAAFTVFCFWMLLESDYMQKTAPSVLFGAGLGLGALYKPTTVLFVFPVLFVFFLFRLKKYLNYKWQLLFIICIIAAAAAVPLNYSMKALKLSLSVYNTNASLYAYQAKALLLVLTNLVIALLGSRLFCKFIGKNKTCADLQNYLYAFSAFYLFFFPWAAANGKTLFFRTHRLADEFIIHSLRMTSEGYNLHNLDIALEPVYILPLAAVILIWLYFKSSSREEKILSAACLTLHILTVILLGPDPRYALPILAVYACFLPFLFQRVPFGNILMLFIAAAALFINVMLPIVFTDRKSVVKPVLYSSMRKMQVSEDNAFYQGLQLARFLETFAGAEDKIKIAGLITDKYADQENPAESIDFAMKTWFFYHKGHVVSINTANPEQLIGENARLIRAYAEKDPLLAGKLLKAVNYQYYSLFDYIITVEPVKLDSDLEKEIRSYLKDSGNKPIYYKTFSTVSSMITVYSLKPFSSSDANN